MLLRLSISSLYSPLRVQAVTSNTFAIAVGEGMRRLGPKAYHPGNRLVALKQTLDTSVRMANVNVIRIRAASPVLIRSQQS